MRGRASGAPLALADGVVDADGVDDGDTVGAGDTDGVGLVVGVGLGDRVGDGAGVGDGDELGDGAGVGVGDAEPTGAGSGPDASARPGEAQSVETTSAALITPPNHVDVPPIPTSRSLGSVAPYRGTSSQAVWTRGEGATFPNSPGNVRGVQSPRRGRNRGGRAEVQSLSAGLRACI